MDRDYLKKRQDQSMEQTYKDFVDTALAWRGCRWWEFSKKRQLREFMHDNLSFIIGYRYAQLTYPKDI
jgi:hypothetical protein